MLKSYLSILFLSLSYLSTSTSLAASTQQVPEDLRFDGKPIDSLCFANLEANKIDLRHCGIKETKYNITNVDLELTKKGYIGYNWEDHSVSYQPTGFTYYQFYPAHHNQYWIYTINNTGGSGNPTSLYLARRIDPNTLSLRLIAGGDRCNGGIEEVSLKNNKLSFDVNLTAYDFIALSNVKIPDLKSYDDLAACAVCCFATASYTVDNNLKPQFNYVTSGEITNPTEMPDQGKYQACFNKLFASLISKNKTVMNQKQLDDFTNQFKNTCIKS